MARWFDGVDDTIDCGTKNFLRMGGNRVQIYAWIYLNKIPTGNGFNIVSKGGANNFYKLRVTDQQRLRYLQDSGGTDAISDTAFTIPIRQWTHVGVIYDGSRIRLFVNALRGSTQAASGNLDNGVSNLFIGSNEGSDGFWNGAIAHVFINEGEFVANEIRQIMFTPGNLNINFGFSNTRKGMYLPLNGSSDPEPDYSGNSNNGIVTGALFAPGPPTGRTFRHKRNRLGFIVLPTGGPVDQLPTIDLTLNMSIVDNETKNPLKHLLDSMAIQQNLTKGMRKDLTDTASLTENVSKEVLKHFTDSASLAETVTKEVLKHFTDTVTVSPAITKDLCKHLSDSLSLTFVEALLLNPIVSILLSQSISVTPTLTNQLCKHLAETLSISETLTKELLKHFTDAISITELKTLIFEKNLTQGITVTETELVNIIVIAVSVARLITFITPRGLIQSHDKRDMINDLSGTSISKENLDDMKQDSDQLNWDWHEGT